MSTGNQALTDCDIHGDKNDKRQDRGRDRKARGAGIKSSDLVCTDTQDDERKDQDNAWKSHENCVVSSRFETGWHISRTKGDEADEVECVHVIKSIFRGFGRLAVFLQSPERASKQASKQKRRRGMGRKRSGLGASLGVTLLYISLGEAKLASQRSTR